MALDVQRSNPPIGETLGSNSRALMILTGELDVSTAGKLYEAFAELTREGVVNVDLDLTALEYIDSAGISVLIAEHKRTSSSGGELIIHTPHRNTRRIFEVAGLIDVLHLEPGELPEDDGGGTGATR